MFVLRSSVLSALLTGLFAAAAGYFLAPADAPSESPPRESQNSRASQQPAPSAPSQSAPAAPPDEQAGAVERPRLVVVVSVDQLAYDYLPRYSHNYSDDGFFRRVEREGASYKNCHHRHAFTYTGPGHAVQLTGAYPSTNGIIGNNWYERATKESVYCVFDDRYPLVPTLAADDPLLTATGKKKPSGVSAERMKVATVGEELRRQRPGSRVFAVAFKDRAAVLMAGHAADGVFWFNEAGGGWVTSQYYARELPPYIAEYNRSDRAQQFAGKEWNLLLPADRYKLHYPDDAEFEGQGFGLGRAFPHQITADRPAYFTQVALTPYGNDLTLEMVQAVLTNERLGQGDSPDLLCVNFSSNDYCGHNYGPHSLEVEDMTLRTDLQLARLTGWLDEQVGAGRWTMIVTADHGVAPIVEYAQQLGLPAKRAPLGNLEALRRQLNQFLAQRFGPSENRVGPIEKLEESQLYLNLADPLVEQRRGEIVAALADFLRKHEGIESVATREELLAGEGKGIRFFEGMGRSFHPEVSGDVLYALKQHHVQSSTPATHGSPWPYDTHVPLLLLGCGIEPGVYDRETSPAAIAATVARLLAVTPPKTCIEPAAHEALRRSAE